MDDEYFVQEYVDDLVIIIKNGRNCTMTNAEGIKRYTTMMSTQQPTKDNHSPMYQKKEAKFNAPTLEYIIIDYITIIYKTIDFSKEVKYIRLLLIRN